MNSFRFAVFGAGHIAGRFCAVVQSLEGCEICAVASKDGEKAARFTAEHAPGARAFAGYETLLTACRPDAVYIATTPDSHAELTKLCLRAGVPVLCEKAMFTTGAEAAEIFALSRKTGIFCMEALWSRFLPVLQKAKAWIEEGAVGEVVHIDAVIGFGAPREAENRYFSPALRGGAATDITCYAYEITRFLYDRPVQILSVNAFPAWTGVDMTDCVTMQIGNASATLKTTFGCNLQNGITVYGTAGRVEIPDPIGGSEATLYVNGAQPERITRPEGDGFRYEIEETVRCVRAGLTESPVVPHALTEDCARLFDRLMASMGTENPADLPEIRPGRYRHYKGREYRVLSVAVARHSETTEPLVIYRALYGEGGVWARPASMWNELVEKDGERVPRFLYIGD